MSCPVFGTHFYPHIKGGRGRVGFGSSGSSLVMASGFWPYTLPREGMKVEEYVPQEMKAYLHSYWLEFPVLHPFIYQLLGIAWLFGLVVAVVGNGLVLYVFAKAPTLRTPANLLVMNLALADFLLMATLVPEFLVNCFMGGLWQFGEIACMVHAFCGALFGYVQIVTMVFISYDRYSVIARGFRPYPLSYTRVVIILIFIWVWSLAWGIAPFFGFGRYALDGILTECSFDYLSRDEMNVWFIWSVCVGNYFLPLTIILLSYLSIAKAVFTHEKGLRDQAKKMNVISFRSGEMQQQSQEIKIAKVAILNVTLWVMAWTPFAIISLIGVSGDYTLLTPMIGSLSVVFAKTSCTYNPIIYAISHPRYRVALRKSVPWACIQEAADSGKDTGSTATVPCDSSLKA